MAVKGGTKLALHRYAEQHAEKLDRVMARVRSIIKGKFLVGYHLPMKVADLGLHQAGGEGANIDVAKLFNSSPTEQQVPISTLCEKYLNLSYARRPSPCYAFTEAKVAMALWHQYRQLRSQITPGTSAQPTLGPTENLLSDQSNTTITKGHSDSQRSTFDIDSAVAH